MKGEDSKRARIEKGAFQDADEVSKHTEESLSGQFETDSSIKEEDSLCDAYLSETEEELEEFLAASKGGDSTKAMSLLQYLGPEDVIDQIDKNGNTALHFAAQNGNIQLYKGIATLCPSAINIENMNGHTPLVLAAAVGCLAIVLWTHDYQREDVKRKTFGRAYFACTTCGLCLNGRERFAARVCSKNRDHKWDGEMLPRHIIFVRAVDFAEAIKLFKTEQKKEGPRPHGWWCKDENSYTNTH